MALKVVERLLLIAITISIGGASVFAWNREDNRYKSYDLNRGPVFYEAYYPDANEAARGDYEEKRFFDRGAVLEKTYQVPSQRLTFPEDTTPFNNYQNRAESLLQGPRKDPLSPQANAQALDIKEISNLARRAISRDLENWNALESYLDRAKYQNPSYGRRMVLEPGYGVQQSSRAIEASLPDSFNEERDLRRRMYEEVFEEPLGSIKRVQSEGQRSSQRSRTLTTRDLAGRGSLGTFESIRYQNQPNEQIVGVREINEANVPSSKQQQDRSIVDPYPPENIFAPRPQVINYIFSKKPTSTVENKVQSVSEVKEKEPIPRNYGDNLIREELKEEEGKDVKVTSIEVSEVPRHKTRHHHGEWPKRDYSKRHQS